MNIDKIKNQIKTVMFVHINILYVLLFIMNEYQTSSLLLPVLVN